MQSLKVGPNHRPAIAAIASSLRRRAAQSKPSYSTREIIEACFPGTVVTGRHLPRGVDDVVQVDVAAFRSHRAPHVIVYQRGIPTPNQRHAIAHALGHIIFDGASHHGCQRFDEDRELRCDRFADELLVPMCDLRPLVKLFPSSDPDEHEAYLDLADQLASRFRVPPICIQRRIRELRCGTSVSE
jgi:Zn-dependent peptidase ImmA (M78 family)